MDDFIGSLIPWLLIIIAGCALLASGLYFVIKCGVRKGILEAYESIVQSNL